MTRHLARRTILLLLPGERLTCAAHHEFPDSVGALPTEEHGRTAHHTRECRWRVRARGEYCGLVVWEWHHGDGTRTVVDIDDTDRRIIESGRYTPRQVLAYLQLHRQQAAS